ncbi:serine hydrolase domain-containing protein [Paenibacillus sp. DYY-L-2]|uniref:serine hydrolase domain-containing protein n=1 Tax=Paenibacillus sp. DYY-L-2 TaxID=3447013 RepID=UPI003F502C73
MNWTKLTEILASLDLRSCLINADGRNAFEYERDSQAANDIAKINSCTKSVLSALICIAMDQGLLPPAETRITEFFPRLAADPDPLKQTITLKHLLTMTAGFDWTEFGGQNSFPRMTRSPDWIEFVLERPLSDPPGTRMEYNSGVSQLLSAILVQATGMSVTRYADQNLFGPLGIDEYKWECDPQGIHTGGFGLWLRPRDMLKFGQLFLQNGEWENKALISRTMVSAAVQPAINTEPPRRGCYAWHWWTDRYPDPNGNHSEKGFDYFYARGYGGQYIHVVPSLSTVVVLSNDKQQKKHHHVDVFRQHIAPLLLR